MSAGVAAIVLAAGESRRMGRAKARLDWGGTPLLQHQIGRTRRRRLRSGGRSPRARADRIAATIRCDGGCQVVRNREYASGRASSLRAGAAALPGDAAAIVVASVDTPVSRATVRALIDAWRALPGPGAIVVPRHGGRNGHPSLFDGALLPELRAVQERRRGCGRSVARTPRPRHSSTSLTRW